MVDDFGLLAAAGVLSGVLAGFLGIGGGTILVPIMVRLGITPIEAVATSSLAIVVTSITGSVQNWRMGFLDLRKVLMLGFPALVTAQLGVLLANVFPDYVLLGGFGLLLVLNVYLVGLRKQVVAQKARQERHQVEAQTTDNPTPADFNGRSAGAEDAMTPADPPHERVSTGGEREMNPVLARLITGSSAGILAGLFGVGGGVIMVPLQILLLGEGIKTAVQTSLGVIVITAIAACSGHALSGNVLFQVGLILGIGGLVGVQVSTRFLPKLPDQAITFMFRALLALLSVYIFWQAWNSYLSR
ncbi:sulfite exporter TauE/SafE family protein [Pseudanabaena sp. FACHB-2040]|uniref:sulfite exporter TauE/SafE family protein n=1 Tax=Pseudanabaena sp. FACHB-2040 TaxID=2692859 RepID=UPI001684D32F|nr:sulfite exporter TauE/SafE family protein [Pseudanabaena sp. FACHB-2040]MBD2260003.1 sulfite exporter TauE/SafE family protein [Pseudanabaena sp. FACHB-2040]